jgi:hypothetical protein
MRPGAAAEALERGSALLAAFQVAEALPLLERARAAGPHDHAEHVRIYEQLGIAYAYLERERDAVAAFDVLLDLDPGHVLSYELSPKVTFLFQRARREAGTAPAVDLDWPEDPRVEDPLRIDVQVVSDPRAFLERGVLHVRRRGQSSWRALDLVLPDVGARAHAVVPAPATGRSEVLEVYLTALDREGNEVLLWAQEDRPRRIPLRHESPGPWWRRWWVWAVVGGALATGTGATVYAVTRDEPDRVPASFSAR